MANGVLVGEETNVRVSGKKEEEREYLYFMFSNIKNRVFSS